MKLLKRIEFNGTNESVVWKHPHNFFINGADLIVPFTHEAIIIKNGQAQESYKPGKHIIDDLSNTKLVFFRKKSNEIIEVYYINKSLNLPIKWGTKTQMDLIDPLLNVPVRIGAHGEFEIKISNPRKFLIKVVGNSEGMSKELIQDFFRDRMAMYIKNSIADIMLKDNISFYQISGKLKELSLSIKRELQNEFDNYGVMLESFLIASVVINEEIKKELEKVFLEKAKEKIKDDTLIKPKAKESAVKPKENIKCPTCGVDVDKSSTFCSTCGNKIYVEEVVNNKEVISEGEVYAET